MVHIYNRILLSYKRRWNTAICDNMDGSWESHAKKNKSNKKSQEPYDFTHICDIKQKATNKKLIDTDNSMAVTRGKEGWEEGKRG